MIAERHARTSPPKALERSMTNGHGARLVKAARLAELLQAVGYAVWQAAEFEDSLAHVVVIRLRKARGVGETRGAEILAKAQRRTMGHLLRELKDAGVLEAELERRATWLVDERNWLIHHAKRENRGALNNGSGYETLLARLARLGEEASDLNVTMVRELEEFIVSSGVDRAQIDEDAKRLQQEWGYE